MTKSCARQRAERPARAPSSASAGVERRCVELQGFHAPLPRREPPCSATKSRLDLGQTRVEPGPRSPAHDRDSHAGPSDEPRQQLPQLGGDLRLIRRWSEGSASHRDPAASPAVARDRKPVARAAVVSSTFRCS
jgi:hypothetical protein